VESGQKGSQQAGTLARPLGIAPHRHFGDVEMIAVVPRALPVAADERGQHVVAEQRRPLEAGRGL
jgi:hypothetical protein